MNFKEQNEKAHYEIKIDSKNELVENLKKQETLKMISENYSTDFENGTLNLYKGLGDFSVVFPIFSHKNTVTVK